MPKPIKHEQGAQQRGRVLLIILAVTLAVMFYSVFLQKAACARY
jgi:hypothetical protein